MRNLSDLIGFRLVAGAPGRDDGPFPWGLFWLLLLALVLYALWDGHEFFLRASVLETGDMAANALQIHEAKHLRGIYGNYSRWGFNHPGPFFFYVYALGEALFLDLLHLVNSPDQAHVLAGIILQAACVAAAAAIVAHLSATRLVAVIWLAAAVVLMPFAQWGLSSIWAPHVLAGPYVLLIVACAGLSTGRLRYLALATLVSCILCHGHVAQPLVALPLLGAGLLLGLRANATPEHGYIACLRDARATVFTSVMIVAVFCVPLVVDLAHCPNCNAGRIFLYLKGNHGATPSWSQSLNYLFSFFVFDHAADLLDARADISLLSGRVVFGCAIALIALVMPRLLRNHMSTSQFEITRALGVFVIVALVLSAFWAHRITGPLYEFNAFFEYGIVYIAVVIIADSLLTFVRSEYSRRVVALALLAAVPIAVAFTPRVGVRSGIGAIATPPLLDETERGTTALINQQLTSNWPSNVALALWLTRQDISVRVPPQQALVYGWQHAVRDEDVLATGSRVEIWDPLNERTIYTRQSFDFPVYCHLDARSAAPEMPAAPAPLDDLRSKCIVSAFGFSKPTSEPTTWTIGKLAAMQFIGRVATADVTVKLNVTPYTGNRPRFKQRVEIYVNGADVAKQEISERQPLVLRVPADVWNRSRRVTLAMHLPDARSPASFGLGDDHRELGLGVAGLGVEYSPAGD